ncbi:MAG: AraC family transcriptional regulator [Roseivirga sp.]|nr:AraC family transcriptional regulator [Roseivirga sp.]
MFEVFIFTNGIFLGILLLLIPSRIKKANVFLALFLISQSFELAPDLFEEDSPLLPETAFLTIPLLFYYVELLISQKIRRGQWLFLIPAVITNALLWVALPEPDEVAVLTEVLVSIPFYGFNLYLLFKMHRSISRHQFGLMDQFASLELRTLKWVKGLVIIFLAFHFVWILEDILLLTGLEAVPLMIISEVLTLLSVFWVGYHGLRQKESPAERPAVPEKANPVLYDKNDEKQFENVKAQIASNKLYLNQELTLRLLAQQVNMNEKKLSLWINQFTNSNFYHLINQYRVAEFKTQLSAPENKNYSLLGIAQNAGFRNKSTFYKVFKELEGITPNEYKKGLKNASKV